MKKILLAVFLMTTMSLSAQQKTFIDYNIPNWNVFPNEKPYIETDLVFSLFGRATYEVIGETMIITIYPQDSDPLIYRLSQEVSTSKGYGYVFKTKNLSIYFIHDFKENEIKVAFLFSSVVYEFRKYGK